MMPNDASAGERQNQDGHERVTCTKPLSALSYFLLSGATDPKAHQISHMNEPSYTICYVGSVVSSTQEVLMTTAVTKTGTTYVLHLSKMNAASLLLTRPDRSGEYLDSDGAVGCLALLFLPPPLKPTLRPTQRFCTMLAS